MFDSLRCFIMFPHVFGQFMHRLLAEFAPVVFMSVGKVFHPNFPVKNNFQNLNVNACFHNSISPLIAFNTFNP